MNFFLQRIQMGEGEGVDRQTDKQAQTNLPLQLQVEVMALTSLIYDYFII